MKRQPWTPERIFRLMEIYPTWSTKDVAKELNTTEAGVLKQASRHGIRKKIIGGSSRIDGKKKCSRCGDWMEYSNFFMRKNGYPRSHCKLCENEAKRDYYLRNPDKKAASDRRYYEKNKEMIVKKISDWNENNRDRLKIIKKRWEEKHPEQTKAIRANRSHLRRAAARGTDITTGYLMRLRCAIGVVCPYCGLDIGKAELDHMIPISKGGKHNRRNVIYCCKKCNRKKFTSTVEEFIGVERHFIFDALGFDNV